MRWHYLQQVCSFLDHHVGRAPRLSQPAPLELESNLAVHNLHMAGGVVQFSGQNSHGSQVGAFGYQVA